jgi:hypothetical protein
VWRMSSSSNNRLLFCDVCVRDPATMGVCALHCLCWSTCRLHFHHLKRRPMGCFLTHCVCVIWGGLQKAPKHVFLDLRICIHRHTACMYISDT